MLTPFDKGVIYHYINQFLLLVTRLYTSVIKDIVFFSKHQTYYLPVCVIISYGILISLSFHIFRH